MERYEVLNQIGEGTFGVVYKCRDRSTGNLVALKKVKPEQRDGGVPHTTIREIATLRRLQGHPNVVVFKEFFHSGYNLFLVFEHLEQDLKLYLDWVHEMPPMLTKTYLYQLINGIAFCHSKQILHRDLKPANLLTDTQGGLKIADFGMARSSGIPVRQFENQVVSLWYRAPELLLGATNYSTSVDIWSIGCIFAEMVMNRPLFAGSSASDQLSKIFYTLGTPTTEIWSDITLLPGFSYHFPKYRVRNVAETVRHLDRNGRDLLARMLIYNPRERISASDALSHPYFDDLNRETFLPLDGSPLC